MNDHEHELNDHEHEMNDHEHELNDHIAANNEGIVTLPLKRKNFKILYFTMKLANFFYDQSVIYPRNLCQNIHESGLLKSLI